MKYKFKGVTPMPFSYTGESGKKDRVTLVHGQQYELPENNSDVKRLRSHGYLEEVKEGAAAPAGDPEKDKAIEDAKAKVAGLQKAYDEKVASANKLLKDAKDANKGATKTEETAKAVADAQAALDAAKADNAELEAAKTELNGLMA